MEKKISHMLGTTLAVLTIAGFKQSNKRFLGLMNTDTEHSILRVPLTAALLYTARKADVKLARTSLLGVGLFYIAMGSAGLADKKVGGLLPSGLTRFDIAYHFAVGAGAVWLGFRPGRMMKP